MVRKARRIFGATLASLALLGGSAAAPAVAHGVVRAHIAVGCNAGVSHHRQHGTGARCQSLMRGVLAHAA